MSVNNKTSVETLLDKTQSKIQDKVSNPIKNTVNPFHKSERQKNKTIAKKTEEYEDKISKQQFKIVKSDGYSNLKSQSNDNIESQTTSLDKLQRSSTHSSLKEKKINKLISKIEKQGERLKKNERRIEKMDKKLETVQTKKKKLVTKLDSSVKTPFSKKVIGKRSLPAKVVVTNRLKNAQSIQKKVEETINDSTLSKDESVATVTNSVGNSANKLKKHSVKKISKSVGFDRKATKLQKLNKKEMRLENQQAKLYKKKRQTTQRKNRTLNVKENGTVLTRIKDFFTKGKEKTTGSLQELISKKMIWVAGAVLPILVLFMFTTPVITTVLGISVVGGGNSTAGINHNFSKEIKVASPHYQEENPYVPTYRGQCTWFVWGRVSEVFDIKLPRAMGDGGSWLGYAQGYPDKFITGTQPRAGSILVLSGGVWGHVSFVESVDFKKGTMIISEGNINNPCSNANSGCNMFEYAREHYKELMVTSEKRIDQPYSSLEIVGYIYLDKMIEQKGE